MASSLKEHLFPSVMLNAEQLLWIHNPQGATGPALVFLDAEIYLESVGVMDVLAAQAPNTRAVFLSHHDAEARHADYVCNSRYAAFLATELAPWIKKQGVQEQLILTGLSLSGLAAAHAALYFPGVFPTALCQSPSFWWEDEKFRNVLPQAAESAPRYWVSVGQEETEADVTHPPSNMVQRASQVDACRRTVEALKEAGYTTEYREFEGGHDAGAWKSDFELALPWALNGRD